MENRQRTIRKLLWRITAVLAVLAVVSICFVSGTFARYVSNRNGSTVTEVAKWDIDFTDGSDEVTNNFTVTVGKLSPDKSEYGTLDGDDNQQSTDAPYGQRVKTTDAVLALQITNSGDVDAYLTITPPAQNALTFYGYDTDGSHAETKYNNWSTTGFAMENGLVKEEPTLAEAQAVITMQFALVPQDTNVADIKWYSLGQEGSNLGTSLTLKAAKQEGETQTEGTSVYCFYARAVWTSRDQHYYDTYKGDLKTAAAMSDGLDTWLGENIAKLGGEFTFSVVQASELPT